MGGFQIWPQNSNCITFDPVFDKKKLWNWQNTELANFRDLFCQKGGHMFCDLNFEARFEIFDHFTYFRPLTVIIFTFEFLPYHDIFKSLQIARRVNFCRNRFFRSDSESVPQKTYWLVWRSVCGKMVITTWPSDLLGDLGGEGHDVSSPTEKFQQRPCDRL